MCISDIKEGSGASIGSIYHFSGTKDVIALALFAQGMEARGAASLKLPAEGSPEDIVKTSVRNTVLWALANPKLYHFMKNTRFLQSLVDRRQTDAALETALAQLAESGQLRVLPWELMHALILGPAYFWLRLHAAGLATCPSEEAIDLLAEAAWDTVKVD